MEVEVEVEVEDCYSSSYVPYLHTCIEYTAWPMASIKM